MQDDEVIWLNRVYGKSVDRLQSPFPQNVHPVHARNEAVATFSVMKEIAGRRNPKALPALRELERLCLNAVDGKIPLRELVVQSRRIARVHGVNNHITHFLDNFQFDNGVRRNNPAWGKPNAAWSIPANAFDVPTSPGLRSNSKSRLGVLVPKRKSVFDIPSAFDQAPARAGSRQRTARDILSGQSSVWANVNAAWDQPSVVKPRKVSRSVENPAWGVKNPAWDYSFGGKKASKSKQEFGAFDMPTVPALLPVHSSPKNKKRIPATKAGSGHFSPNPWNVQNPTFSKEQKQTNARLKKAVNKTGIVEWI